MNSIVGAVPPQLSLVPPQRELTVPSRWTPELLQVTSEAMRFAGFVASTSVVATGVAPSLVTTNCQAITSNGEAWCTDKSS
jgi:hypothetical protein